MTDRFIGYRRRIRIIPRERRVDVDMEDDAHCFGVTIIHDGSVIEAVETRAPRFPWTTCPAAGTYLSERMTGVLLAQAADVENQRHHCTHMYDLFVLAARHAADQAPLTYDIRVSDPDRGVRETDVARNGDVILRWKLGGSAGAEDGLGGDMTALDAWTRELPLDLQEAGRMLRRGAMVSGTRFFDFPVGAPAAGMSQMIGACFTYQPERAGTALRVTDTIRDFSDNPEKMLTGESNDRRVARVSRP